MFVGFGLDSSGCSFSLKGAIYVGVINDKFLLNDSLVLACLHKPHLFIYLLVKMPVRCYGL